MLNRVIPKTAPDPLARLRDQMETAQRAQEAVEEQVGADTLGGKSPDTSALMSARSKVASIRNAIAAAERVESIRAAEAELRAEEQALAGRRAKAATAMRNREKAAAELEVHAVQLAKAFRTLCASNSEMIETRLANDLEGALLSPLHIDMAVRCHLAKALRAAFGEADGPRFNWVAKGVPGYLVDELPPLRTRIEGGNLHFKSQRRQ